MSMREGRKLFRFNTWLKKIAFYTLTVWLQLSQNYFPVEFTLSPDMSTTCCLLLSLFYSLRKALFFPLGVCQRRHIDTLVKRKRIFKSFVNYSNSPLFLNSTRCHGENVTTYIWGTVSLEPPSNLLLFSPSPSPSKKYPLFKMRG